MRSMRGLSMSAYRVLTGPGTRGGPSEAVDRCLCLSFLAVYACATSVPLHERISCAQRAWDAWWPV